VAGGTCRVGGNGGRITMIECGKRIPDSEHAVSMSLPTLRDVIGYEEKSAEVLSHICSGYPRFVRHWTVERVQSLLRERLGCDGGTVVVLHDRAACERLSSFLGCDVDHLDGFPFGVTVLPADADGSLMALAHRFQQHTGLMLSSRQAEDFLVEAGELARSQPETLFTGEDPGGAVRGILAGLYGVREDGIALYPSGMNAFFSVFDALNRIQRQDGRRIWVQAGWLYLDTTAILDRFSPGHVHFKASAIEAMESYLAVNSRHVAGITTEVMTNPLLNTPDLIRLSALARRHGLPLIVDTSMPTPLNVDVFPYADVVVESLTKFASGHADVMSGAAVFNEVSEWGQRLKSVVVRVGAYERDLRRIAYSIQGYAARMRAINTNAAVLTGFFRSNRRVREVHWAGQPDSADSYDALRRPGGGDGGVVSVVFEKPLVEVYDRLDLYKGPSFGTEFTLCMAYVYMAHYDLVTTAAGRSRLQAEGIDPDLLRISIGMEPAEDLIRAFESVM